MTNVTNQYVAGNPVAAVGFMQNWNDLAAAVDAIKTNNIDANAGITSKQLADRYATWTVALQLVDITSGTDLGASGTLYTFPAAFTSRVKWYFVSPAGKECYLCSVQAYCMERSGADNPAMKVYVNSNLIGNQEIDFTTGGNVVKMENPNQIASPLYAVQTGDLIDIQLGRSGAGGPPMARGVTALLTFATEIGR